MNQQKTEKMTINSTKQISLLFIFIFFRLTACKKEKGITASEVENALSNHIYVVSEYLEEGENETHHFDGFDFYFDDTGVLSVTNGVKNFTGTWIVQEDNDADSVSDLIINIDVPETSEFEDLNDDWDVIRRTKETIELRDVSGGDGSVDLLTFKMK